MAITTAADVITEIRALVRGADSTTASSYLAIAVDRLCFDLPILVGKYSLALTADTSEYSFGSGSPWYTQGTTTTATTASVIRIESASYLESSESATLLDPVSVDELNALAPRWRYTDSSNPTHIYNQNSSAGVTGFGFFPAPDTTSDPANGSGYPRVDFVTWNTFSATFAGAVTIPSSIRNPMVLAYAAAYAIAEREGDGATRQTYYDLYMLEKNTLAHQLMGGVRNQHPIIANRPRAPRTV